MILYSLELQFYKLKKYNVTSFSETFTRLIKETIKTHKSREKIQMRITIKKSTDCTFTFLLIYISILLICCFCCLLGGIETNDNKSVYYLSLKTP